jgi:type IV pilus assembly protein PilV
MPRPVAHTENGFTLIEFLIALCILTVGLFGLLVTINVSISQNMSNKLRADAVVIADQIVSADRARPLAGIVPSSGTKPANAGISFVNYSVVKTVAPVSAATIRTQRVTVRVKWREKGLIKEHSLVTCITN